MQDYLEMTFQEKNSPSHSSNALVAASTASADFVVSNSDFGNFSLEKSSLDGNL